jgi:GT2 family glycosyltransferase/glycosyltransferase involved in cell wall biosynthesis
VSVSTSTADITVLIPVYEGHDAVIRCVESVLAHAEGLSRSFDLLLIDDASPDGSIRGYVDEVGSRSTRVPTTVFHNATNRGFAATVNSGFARTTGDVVVLNADTEVTHGWLDRLADAAVEHDVATVTPLTNSGSICTLPKSIIAAFSLDGPEPRTSDCGAFVARHGLGLRREVITGVGFCMYVTRQALDACGVFDVETFGEGYGEEVDFCLRASRLGFRHLVEDTAFVFHEGGVSFGDRRTPQMAKGSARLHERYEYFRSTNTRERFENPLSVPFAALELALHPRDETRPHVLHILHSGPDALGGTEKHLEELMESLAGGFDFSILHPVDHGFVLRTHWGSRDAALIQHEFFIAGAARRTSGVSDPGAAAALRTALDLFDFDAVHIQNLIGHSLAPLSVLDAFDGTVVCSVRDLYLACPHHWLLYRNQSGCGIPEDLDYCATCLPETRGLTPEFLREFRAEVEAHLGSVDRWVFASQSAADYLLRVYEPDPDRIRIIEHGAIVSVDPELRGPDVGLVFDEPLRLAFVGLGWAKKGLDLVNRLADDLSSTSIEIHHFGELLGRPSANLRLHGRYDNALLPHLLDQAGIQVVLLPGPYAETFGHVMTEALVAGRPVIGARYGALGERIRDSGGGWTVDPDDYAALRDLVEQVDRSRLALLRATEAAATAPVGPVAATAHRYADLYRGYDAATSTGPGSPGRPPMTDREERLRRELRATTAVNRQLLAQLEGSGSGRPTSVSGRGGRSRLRRLARRRAWPWVRRYLPSRLAHRVRDVGRRVL